MRALALLRDPSEVLAGLWRGPRPEEAPVEKTLADLDCSPLQEATRNPYLKAWLPSWVRRQGDFLTAVIPKPCESLSHLLLCERTGKEPGMGGGEEGGHCIYQSFRVLPLPLHLTWSFEKQTLNHAWHAPGTKHLEKKMESIPGGSCDSFCVPKNWGRTARLHHSWLFK